MAKMALRPTASVGALHAVKSSPKVIFQRAVLCAPLCGPRQPPTSRCSAYQHSQASNALHQAPQHDSQALYQDSQLQQPERHHIDPNEWDMNYWHYQPWWLQPHTAIGTGVAFFVASLIFNIGEPTFKTAALAAGPVAVYWFIFLFLLPRTFKSFAVEYIETHPEVEELAHQEEHQQQQQE